MWSLLRRINMYCCGNLPIHLSAQRMDSVRESSLHGNKISVTAHFLGLSSGCPCHVDLLIMIPLSQNLTKPFIITTHYAWEQAAAVTTCGQSGRVDKQRLTVFPNHSPKRPSFLRSKIKHGCPSTPHFHHLTITLYGLAPAEHTLSTQSSCYTTLQFDALCVWDAAGDSCLPDLCQLRTKERVTEARGCDFQANP